MALGYWVNVLGSAQVHLVPIIYSDLVLVHAVRCEYQEEITKHICLGICIHLSVKAGWKELLCVVFGDEVIIGWILWDEGKVGQGLITVFNIQDKQISIKCLLAQLKNRFIRLYRMIKIIIENL